MCAARIGDDVLAEKDIEFVKKFPAWQAAGTRLDAGVLVEKKSPKEARALLDELPGKSAEDWILYARALEMEADMPGTPLDERQKMQAQAAEIRKKYSFTLEYDFGE